MSEASSHKPGRPPTGSSIQPPANPSSSVRQQPADGQQTVISSRPPTPPLSLSGSVPLESGSLWEGEQLGQFVLQKFVGGGGMGIVFRALDTTLDREVAVKVLSRDQSADEETLRRFRNEAQSAARLNHDNIARVFYVGEDRGVHYIVFEFIEGVNIRDLVDHHGPLPLDQALSYTYQIAQALDHASQRSVIHRDIKPSNVLVTPDGKAKLVDMGLARLNLIAQASNDLTASGVTLGTFDYISPEQARDPRSADVRSDLYSLGCSFFFMLTGRPPFPEGTVLQKLLQHQADSPPDPRVLRPELPLPVGRVLSRLLAKTPADRYQQPSELIDELAALGRSLGMQLSESQTPRVVPQKSVASSRWLRQLPWALPLAALFLIVLGLDVYWSRSLPPAREAVWNTPDDRLPAVNSSPPTPPEILIPEPSLKEPRPTETTAVPSPVDPPPAESDVASTPAPEEMDDIELSGAGQFLQGILKPVDEFAARLNARSEAMRVEPGGGASEAEQDDLDLAKDDRDVASAPAPRPVEETGVLTVGDDRAPANYNTLYAACAAAKDGDTIELRYDGRRTERPLAIANIKLTLRAGTGYRPVVAFAPDPGKPYARPEMVSVAGGQLLASDIHWELDLPPNSPAVRALFETQRADLLDFQRCTFTIRGQPLYHAGVAFFDVQAPPGSNSMGMGGTAMEAHVVTINLQNCMARGEATLLRDAELQNVRLTWNNGLFVTSERLFVADGDAILPRQEARAEIVLRSVTVMVGSGLVQLTNSPEAPYQLVTDLRCEDTIIATTGSSPLIEQRGSAGIEEFISQFRWHSDNAYFYGFDVFWQIMSSSGQSPSKQFDFDLWRDHFRFSTGENLASGREAVVFEGLPARSRPYHEHLPQDYALDTGAADNAARRGGTDGMDAGGQLLYLPVPPAKSGPPEYPSPVGPFTTPPAKSSME